METCYFRDQLFDLLNGNDQIGIIDLEADEKRGVLVVEMKDGTEFEIICRKIN